MSRAAGSSEPSPGPRTTDVGRAPDGEPFAAVMETHTSVVLLLGDRAYKIKKPVRLPFVDLSTRALRVENCRREVELNRRIAPDVYLGIDELRAVEGDTGDDGEPVVVMRRMPTARRLSALLSDPALHADAKRCVLDTARQVAVFHAGLPAVQGYDLPGTMAALWWEGRDQTTRFEAAVLDREALDETYSLAAEYLEGREGLLRARERSGLVRDGHGDLLTDDVYCLDDGARVLDCLEFDARLREGDALLDIAFLAMDLCLHGAPDLARKAVDRYRELDAESHPRSLEHHYVGYRAWVRAKVECLRDEGGDPGARQRARAALELSRSELRAGRVHLVLVGGLPGSGKSRLAEALVDADDRDWATLSSDEVRKELAGIPPTTSARAAFGEGIYDPAHTERTYAELMRRAAAALDGGLCVALDASLTDGSARSRAAELAAAHGAALTQVRCDAPAEVCVRRLAEREGTPHVSDAYLEVFTGLAQREAPWPEALPVDTSGSVEDAAARVLEALADRPVAPRSGPMGLTDDPPSTKR